MLLNGHQNLVVSRCRGLSFEALYRTLFPETKPLTDSSLAEAKSWVSRVEADLGGTEIFSPLEHVLQLPRRAGKPRQVFVLTDGAVSNSLECIKLVRNRMMYDRE